MKTILVPTDFSEPARNAAQYALALAADTGVGKIVFYNAYQAPPVMTETSIPAMPLIDIETMQSISEQGMATFLEKLQQDCPEGIILEHKTVFSILAKDIDEICKNVGAELIVMGITGTSKIEEILIGSTAISVVKNTKIPVIVVPGEATYHSIRNIMLACDYKNVAETTPLLPIKTLLHATRASLYVVNVNEDDTESSQDKRSQMEVLGSLLKEFKPRFEFVDNADFIEGINEFVEAYHIDLVIAIPRRHKIFEGLFRERHTKKLAFHSHVPLLYIHTEDL